MKKALALALGMMLASRASAAPSDLLVTKNPTSVAGTRTDTSDAVALFVGMLNFILGLMGLIAVVMIIIGAVQYMTSMGNSDKTAEARKLIIASAIGLVILAVAYTLVTWVVGTFATVNVA